MITGSALLHKNATESSLRMTSERLACGQIAVERGGAARKP